MKSPSNGNVHTAFGDPRRVPEREPIADLSSLDTMIEDLSTLDTLIEEPVPNARTPPAIVRPRPAAATLPALAKAAADSGNRVNQNATRARPSRTTVLIVLLILIVLSEAAAIALLLRRSTGAGVSDSGAFVMETVPAGARVVVDDTDRGATPLSLTLAPGAHKVVLTLGGQSREIPIDVAAGGSYIRHVEFAAAPAPGATTGDLEIRTRPVGAAVVIAGQARGKTPVTVRDLPPGTHDVLLQLNGQQLRETVTVQTGTTVQLSAAFSAPSASRGSGWIAIASPVELTIVENGQILGTTRSPRIMLPAGRHTLELVNERLGFRATRVMDVDDGKTATFAPELPKGTVSVNALPWAEVWMQDRKVGDTPLANLSLPIGSHQLVFRHPSLGERRQDVLITAGAPARISVDMRR